MHLNTPHKLLKERDKELNRGRHLERFVTRGVYLILRQCLGGWCLSRTRCFSTRRFDYRYSLHPSVVLMLRLIGDGRSGTCPWTAGRPAWHQCRLQWACTRTAGSKGALCGRWVAPDGSRNTDRPRPAPPELPVAEETNHTLVRMNPKQQNTFYQKEFL